jgi:hypothetical protein
VSEVSPGVSGFSKLCWRDPRRPPRGPDLETSPHISRFEALKFNQVYTGSLRGLE